MSRTLPGSGPTADVLDRKPGDSPVIGEERYEWFAVPTSAGADPPDLARRRAAGFRRVDAISELAC